MLFNVLESFVLGFVVAAVPGAILIETVRRTIFDKSTILSFTAGNLAGMAVLVGVSFLGITAITNNATVGIILNAIGGSVLVFLGIKSLFSKPKYHIVHRRVSNMKREYSSFTTGFILSLANPIRIAFWISLIGAILYENPTFRLAVAKSLSVFLGVSLFYLILIGALLKVGPRIKHTYLVWLSRLLGLAILAYGIGLLLRTI